MSELKPSHEYNKDELYRMLQVLYSDFNKQYKALNFARWIILIQMMSICMLSWAISIK
jgi:hypothetical protein